MFTLPSKKDIADALANVAKRVEETIAGMCQWV